MVSKNWPIIGEQVTEKKVASYHADYNSIIKNWVHQACFQVISAESYNEGVFSRSYCCYGNLLCHKIDSNLFTNDWAVF